MSVHDIWELNGQPAFKLRSDTLGAIQDYEPSTSEPVNLWTLAIIILIIWLALRKL